MANFPAVRCSSITNLPGSFRGVRHVTVAGNMRHHQGANRVTGGGVRLAFRGISDADLALLIAHWNGEQRLGSWLLSTEILDGLPYAPELSAARWRYKARPRIVDSYANVHDAEIELEYAPVTPWVDTVLLIARPASVGIGAAARLIGPDTLPAIWVSRLTTAGNNASLGIAEGNIALDAQGNSYQAFWFTASGQSDARVVVIKRDTGGAIIRQWWTSATIGAPNAGIGSLPPAVIPEQSGGCIVAMKINDAINNNVTRVWRLNADGTQAWAKNYSMTVGCPMQLVYLQAANELLLATKALDTSNRQSPVLVRIDASDGDVISGRRYSVDSTNVTTRSILVLPSGSIAILVRRNDFSTAEGKRFYMLQASSDLATVEQVHGYGTPLSDGTIRGEGGIAIASNGDFLMSTTPASATYNNRCGLLRLSSSYSVVAHYHYPRTATTTRSLLGTSPISIASGSDGSVYMLGLGSLAYFGAQDITFTALTDNGAGVSYITEAEVEQTASADQILGSEAYQIDVDRQRIVLSTFASVTGYFAMAQGYAMEQTVGAATVLDIGNSRDVKAITTTPAPGNVINGPTITRYNVSATSASLTVTAAAGSVSMVDASASLSWVQHRAYA